MHVHQQRLRAFGELRSVVQLSRVLRSAEVEQLHRERRALALGAGDENVLRFEIAVHDPSVVRL